MIKTCGLKEHLRCPTQEVNPFSYANSQMIDTASYLYGSSLSFGNASMILSVCGMWRQTMLLLAHVLLLGTTSAYAADCRTSFDQSCLSRDYDAEQVEADHQAAQEELEASQKAKDEQATVSFR
jgi:hypothetical protein